MTAYSRFTKSGENYRNSSTSTRNAELRATLGSIALVAGVALLVRALYLMILSGLPEWSLLSIDNHYYHNWAQLLAAEGWLGEGAYFRAPLYPLLLSVCYQLFGPDLLVARIFGLIFSTGSVVLTLCITTRLFGRSAGLIAALVHALLPLSLYFDHELLSEGLMILFLQCSIIGWLRWRQDEDLRGMLLFSGGFFLAIVTRPLALVLLPLWLFELVRAYRASGLSGGWKAAVLGILPVFFILGPLVARNYQVQSSPLTIATQGGINFYLGNHADADGVSAVMPEPLGFNWQLSDISLLATRAKERPLTPEGVSDYWYRRGFSWLTENPGEAVSLFANKLTWALSGTEVSNNRPDEPYLTDHPMLSLNPLRFVLLFPLAVFGLIVAIREIRTSRWLGLVNMLFFLALILFMVNARFRFPLVVLLLPFAAYGLVGIFEFVRTRKVNGKGIAVIGGLAALGLTFLPTPEKNPLATPQYATAGLALMSQNLPAEALRFFVRDLPSGAPESALNVGNAWFALGQSDSARSYYEQERSRFPERAKAWTNLASLALAGGDIESALNLSREAIRRKPHDPDAHLVYLRSLATAEKIDTLVLAGKFAAATTHKLEVAIDASALFLRYARPSDAAILLEAALQFPNIPYEQDDLMWTSEMLTKRAERPLIRAKGMQNLSTAYLLMKLPSKAVPAARIAYEISGGSLESTGALLLALHEAGLTTERDALISGLKAEERTSPDLAPLLDYIASGKTMLDQ